MNAHLSPERAMSETFLMLVLNLQIVSFVLFLPYVLTPEGHWIEPISDATDLAAGLAFMVWGFRMRTRAQELFGYGSGFFVHLGGLWTFLFSPFYFNYKINQICEARDTSAE